MRVQYRSSNLSIFLWVVLFILVAVLAIIFAVNLDSTSNTVTENEGHISELEDVVLLHLDNARRSIDGPPSVPHVRRSYVTSNGYYQKGDPLGLYHLCDTKIDNPTDKQLLAFNDTLGLWVPMTMSAAVNLVTSVAGKIGDVVLDTSDILSGTFDDARISESSVTQHEGAIDHNTLFNYNVDQHRVINDAGFGLDDL